MTFDNEAHIVSKCIVLISLDEQLTLLVRCGTIRFWSEFPHRNIQQF